MLKMEELYQKVAADSMLRTKFTEIMKRAEASGEEVTKQKLLAFAEEAGYQVSLDEMKAFFHELAEKDKGELADYELDMVAGGKSPSSGQRNFLYSASTFGLGCIVNSRLCADA